MRLWNCCFSLVLVEERTGRSREVIREAELPCMPARGLEFTLDYGGEDSAFYTMRDVVWEKADSRFMVWLDVVRVHDLAAAVNALAEKGAWRSAEPLAAAG